MNRTIRMREYLPFKSEKVWFALTDSELLGEWFMRNNFKPVNGYEFNFEMAPQKGWDGITHCKITKIEEMRLLTYSYKGSASGEKTLACAGIHSEAADKVAKGIFTRLDTVLSFKLEPTCGGTILTLEHSGFKGLKLLIISFVFQMGWKKQIKKLNLLLEKMSGENFNES